MGIKLKRILAFVIDWNVTFLPLVLIISILIAFLPKDTSVNPLIILFCPLMILVAFGAFILRDGIFKGRSLGKRILGLYIYESKSFGKASLHQCFLRNIFFFICFIDGIILLLTERTIGDRVAGTFVMTEQDLVVYKDNLQNQPSVPKKKKPRDFIRILAIVFTIFIAFIGLIQIVLHAQKDSEEYKIAYSYFVNSQAFKALNADESSILFNQYSLNTHTSKDTNSVSQTVKIGFMVNFKSFEVICHRENNVWVICNECTRFQ